MADTDTAAPPPDDLIRDFAMMTSAMARLLDRVSSLDAFTSSGLHVAEWQALSVIATSDGHGNNVIAKRLGVSSQRTQQICDILLKQGLISVERSSEDGRRKMIRITPAGEAVLQAIRERLTRQLDQDLGEGVFVVNRIIKFIRPLLCLGLPPKADGTGT